MANRRLGGGMGGGGFLGGGPQRGPRSFSQNHQPFQRNTNVSPWQGNMPSNNPMNQGGLLGQLAANPQQLAIALTNLLQPQQQQMNNPPSLLSLNTSPAFSQQDNRDSFSRFGANRPNPRSDFRRNEPYNKNQNRPNWRSNNDSKNIGNRNNNRNFGQHNNKKPQQQQQQQQQRPKPNNNKQDEPKRVNPVPKVKQEIVKEDKPKLKEEPKTADNSIVVPEGGDEEGVEDTKRDWKEEKNTLEEAAPNDGDEEPEPKGKPETRSLEGKYQGVQTKFLHCFVCNKDMWDGESFQKHIRGHAHKQMLQSLEESFHITVNILRENMRLAEEKKVIEWNRMQRLNRNKYNRNKFQEPESHCNMCDLKFLGKIITHRKTEGHQRLKRFLHPNCTICGKEFPSRMDWVDHRLTPEHLRTLSEKLAKTTGNEQGNSIENEQEVDLEPLLEESIEMEEEHPILELSDDLVNFQNRMPAFKRSRAIATESLKAFTGFMCEICHKSFENEALAQGHLKTQSHYYNFVDAVKLKFKRQSEETAEKEAESRKRKREDTEKAEPEPDEQKAEEEEEDDEQNGNDMYDPEEACNEAEEKEEGAEAAENGEGAEEEEEEELDEELILVPEEPAVEEIKPKVEPVTPEPNPAPARVTRRGPVKKNMALRGKKLAEILLEGKSQTVGELSAFRIPKKGSKK